VTEAHEHPESRQQWQRIAAECACLSLRKTARAVTQVFDEALASSGLRATQFTLLVAVGLTDPPTMTRIAEALVMDRSTLTRNLRHLERAGLVKTAGSRDRRIRLVALTPRGRARLRAALPMWERAQNAVVGSIGVDRWHGILAELVAVRQGRAAS
jgi:DNA-binding MarR family transcriptional regulator